MVEMWRLFVALDLPPEIVGALTQMQEWLKGRTPGKTVRWVKPNSVHLTLKFLGDVPVARRETLQDALTQAVQDRGPFTLAAGGLGCFPNFNRPRVTWVGLHRDLNALHALRDAVEAHIAPLGYPTENRPFHPHLTLGRVHREASRDAVRALGKLIAESGFKDRYDWQANAVTLFRSELKPGGAVYTPLFHAALDG
ncbi:MAG: RNA 2',3'-cyclic phosphodiesterase [Anaerolineae bacterium]|nr:RNA 2',3'-cyclic phosphodiesterase [Anaerolineae bacterium]